MKKLFKSLNQMRLKVKLTKLFCTGTMYLVNVRSIKITLHIYTNLKKQIFRIQNKWIIDDINLMNLYQSVFSSLLHLKVIVRTFLNIYQKKLNTIRCRIYKRIPLKLRLLGLRNELDEMSLSFSIPLKHLIRRRKKIDIFL